MAGNKLFGADIAGEISKQTKGQLLPATLHSHTEGTYGADPTTGRNSTYTDYACEGIADDYHERLVDGERIHLGDKKILLIGNSINGGATVPKPGDHVTIEGVKYDVKTVKRDPAAAAYTLQGREGI